MEKTAALVVATLVAAACEDATQPQLAPLAPPQFAVSGIVLGSETQITDESEWRSNPAVDGERIVWEDWRNGHDGDIYLYDIATGTETQITTNSAPQWFPAISGDWVVWLDGRIGGQGVYAYNLATMTENRISGPSAWVPLGISGDRIVWAERPSGNWDIYLYDLAAHTQTRITTDASGQWHPAISGDRIVWDNGADIFLYDLASGETTQITTDPAVQEFPDISGDRIVWQDRRHVNTDIYMYDLATGLETQITANSAYQWWPAIFGDRIVWTDDRNWIEYSSYNQDIYFYDVAAGTEAPLITAPATQRDPAISGAKVVWKDERDGDHQIYLFDLATAVVDAILPIWGRVGEFVADGSISNSGLEQPLRALLEQASSAVTRGASNAAVNTLTAFVRLVRGQSGKAIDPEAAQTLIELAQEAIDDLS